MSEVIVLISFGLVAVIVAISPVVIFVLNTESSDRAGDAFGHSILSLIGLILVGVMMLTVLS